MKIAWLTKFKGIESTNVGMIAALEELGHQVMVTNSQKYATRGHHEEALRSFLEDCQKADACVVTKGNWIPKNRFQWLANQVDLTMFIPDSISVGPPGRDIEHGHRALMCNRVILTGTEGARWLRENGYRNRIAQIYQGYRPDVWRRKEKYTTNTQIVFLGSVYKGDGNRRAKMNAITRAGFTMHYHRRTFMEKAAKLYYNTPISINFNCGDITSNRVMRIMASRGFCLSQSNADIKHSFSNGTELAWWDEPEGDSISEKAMLDSIRYWLDHENARNLVAETGYEWAKNKTWVDQMEKHIRFIQGEIVPADGAASPYVEDQNTPN